MIDWHSTCQRRTCQPISWLVLGEEFIDSHPQWEAKVFKAKCDKANVIKPCVKSRMWERWRELTGHSRSCGLDWRPVGGPRVFVVVTSSSVTRRPCCCCCCGWWIITGMWCVGWHAASWWLGWTLRETSRRTALLTASMRCHITTHHWNHSYFYNYSWILYYKITATVDL